MNLLKTNLNLILIFRSVFIFSIFIFLIFSFFILKIQLPFFIILILLLFSSTITTLSHFLVTIKFLKNSPFFIFIQLIIDSIILSYIIFLTGGISNPFSGIFLVHVIVAAILLPYRLSILFTLIIISNYVLLSFSYSLAINDMHHSLHSNHYYGMVISYIFSSLLVAFFAIKMTMNNRKQDILIQEITQKFNQNLIVSEYGLAAANAAQAQLGATAATRADDEGQG